MNLKEKNETTGRKRRRIIEALLKQHLLISGEDITQTEFDLWIEMEHDKEESEGISNRFEIEFDGGEFEPISEKLMDIGLEKLRDNKDLIEYVNYVRKQKLEDYLKEVLTDSAYSQWKLDKVFMNNDLGL